MPEPKAKKSADRFDHQSRNSISCLINDLVVRQPRATVCGVSRGPRLLLRIHSNPRILTCPLLPAERRLESP